MKKIYLLSLIFEIAALAANGQGGVAINVSGAQPDSSALFDVSSITKGVLSPRMTTAQRNAIANPAEGLTIYNTDCHVYNFNAGTPASPDWATVNSSNALVAGVTIAANPPGAICTGTGVTFVAVPSQNNLSPAYQWKVNGIDTGTNSTIFIDSSLNNGDVVTCVLSSSANCIVGSPATSNPITILVNTTPYITQTYPDSFCSGSTATLTAVASAGSVNWYAFPAGGSSLATSGTYTISGLTATNTYYVDATANGCTTASRTPVTATYYPQAPGQLGNISSSAGNSLNMHNTASYWVSAVSNAGSYFWNVPLGNILSGQGTDTITVRWDTTGFGAVYVTANNPCGSSNTVSLLPITVSTSSQSFTYTGGQQSFTVPNGVTTVGLAVYGAQGGGQYSNGANGGYASGSLNVTPGQLLYVYVGGQNSWNGGGTGGQGDNGGGMTDVRTGGNTFANWVIVAGGGGGGGSDGGGYVNTASGTGGGGVQCTNGAGGGGGGYYNGYSYSSQGGAGTCTDGGASGNSYGGWAGGGGGGGLTSGGTGGVTGGYGSAGSPGEQGQGGTYGSTGGCSSSGGGGGGGYYGGGGAASGDCASGSGGGGSSWAANTVSGPVFAGGLQTGNGQAVIVW